jgi:hypothetical protein
LAVTKFNIEIDNEKIFNRRANELMLNNLEGFSVINVKNEANVEDAKKLEDEFKERDELLLKSMISTIPVIIDNVDNDKQDVIVDDKDDEMKIQDNLDNLSSEIPTSQYQQAFENLERIPSSEINKPNTNNEEYVENNQNINHNEEEVIKGVKNNEEVDNKDRDEHFDIIENNENIQNNEEVENKDRDEHFDIIENNEDIQNNEVEDNSIQQHEQSNVEPIPLLNEQDNQHENKQPIEQEKQESEI